MGYYLDGVCIDSNGMYVFTSFKSMHTIYCLPFALAAIAGTYSMGYPSMMRDLNCTMFQATLGLSAYPLGSAIFPLILAPLSEEFGRQPLYIGATILMAAMHLGIAL